MLLLRPPGVYPPQEDTWLLTEILRAEIGSGAPAVLDICTGTGALALAAARAGAGSVTAVDIGRRAVLTARVNAAMRGVRIRVLRGDMTAPVRGRRFDVVVSNPPYVVADRAALPTRGVARCFDGGLDGRALLDRVCAEAPAVLRPGGRLLLVHSGFNDVGRTLENAAAHGMSARVVAQCRVPFGPVLHARARMLETRGVIEVGDATEELVVVRAVTPS